MEKLVIVLFFVSSHLPFSLQQRCYQKDKTTPGRPTIELSHFPDVVIKEQPFNVTCTARLPETDSFDFLMSVYIRFKNTDLKYCKVNGDKSVFTCNAYVSNALYNNSGKYSCYVKTYYHGCTYLHGMIIVQDPTVPKILLNPSNSTNMTVGQNINLTCTTFGVPPPVVSWTKDNVMNIKPSRITRYGGNTTSVLGIEAINVAQYGVYHCQANNSEGTALSHPSLITGLIPPLVNISMDPPRIIIYGDTLNIRCTAVTPVIYPTLIWSLQDMSPKTIVILKSGKTLKTCNNTMFNGTMKRITSCVVTLQNAKMSDAGEYTCIATNAIDSSSVLLNVVIKALKPPYFTLHPKNRTVDYGKRNVTLECSATGVPQPVITWLRNNSLIGNEEKAYGNDSYSLLVIPQIATNFTTRYRCYAHSRAGESYSKTAIIAVHRDLLPPVTTTGSPTSASKSLASTSLDPTVYQVAVIIGVILALILLSIGIMLGYRRYKLQGPKGPLRFYTFTSSLENDTFNLEDKNVVAQLRDVRKVDSAPINTDEDSINDEMYLKLLGVDRNWELDRQRLVITNEKLGGGEFGVVKRGIYTRTDGKDMIVAVKQLKDTAEDAERKALLTELNMLRSVGHHPHIVSLVGACTTQEPLCVVIEFVSGGSLDKLLVKSRVTPRDDDLLYMNIRSRLNERELLDISLGVAKGMCHLERKECIHRDLAARNVLIAKGLVAKVTDFGLARDVSCNGKYIKTSAGKVAWKWQSLESLQGIYSTKSDVWSFGILLWEILTLGQEPYKGEANFVSLYYKIQNGYRLEKPAYCSDELYQLMSQCWQKEPEERPSFTEIRKQLKDFLRNEQRQYINIVCPDEGDELVGK